MTKQTVVTSPSVTYPDCKVVMKKNGTQAVFIGDKEIANVRSYQYNSKPGEVNSVRLDVLINRIVFEYEA